MESNTPPTAPSIDTIAIYIVLLQYTRRRYNPGYEGPFRNESPAVNYVTFKRENPPDSNPGVAKPKKTIKPKYTAELSYYQFKRSWTCDASKDEKVFSKFKEVPMDEPDPHSFNLKFLDVLDDNGWPFLDIRANFQWMFDISPDNVDMIAKKLDGFNLDDGSKVNFSLTEQSTLLKSFAVYKWHETIKELGWKTLEEAGEKSVAGGQDKGTEDGPVGKK